MDPTIFSNPAAPLIGITIYKKNIKTTPTSSVFFLLSPSRVDSFLALNESFPFPLYPFPLLANRASISSKFMHIPLNIRPATVHTLIESAILTDGILTHCRRFICDFGCGVYCWWGRRIPGIFSWEGCIRPFPPVGRAGIAGGSGGGGGGGGAAWGIAPWSLGSLICWFR